MPVMLIDVITEARSRLDEDTPLYWQDDELTRWINEACRDISRRTESLLTYNTQLLAVTSVNKYALPPDVIRVHRVEFDNLAGSVYTLEPRTYYEMDQLWGSQQATPSNYPLCFVLWGASPNMTIQIWPAPSATGRFNVFYYRLPKEMVNMDDVADIPEGWHDLITDYVEYKARRKDKDQTWQEAKQLYESNLTNMIDTTRQLHDQAQYFTYGPRAVPSWLATYEDV